MTKSCWRLFGGGERGRGSWGKLLRILTSVSINPAPRDDVRALRFLQGVRYLKAEAEDVGKLVTEEEEEYG